jgi:aspartyl-tRNA(Asn)/glutamyl-tRNA(Gln) amidotransferase subunit B
VLFDPDQGETRVMRTKEDAHDYRYFPDPGPAASEMSEDADKKADRGMMPKALEEQPN